jgi:glycosyltransferase involved in cell wall biosynthesis
LPYLLKQKYDKIFLFQTSPVMMSLTGILLGKIKKIETTMYVLDLWPENLYSVLNVRSRFLRRVAYTVSTWHYRGVDKIVANSRKLQWILQRRVKIDKNKIMFMPQFCEKIYEETIEDESLKERFKETFNLVFTGNISPAQSFETVIDAAKVLKEKGLDKIMWIIVGDGMSRQWLETQVKKEGLSASFTFIGQVPMEEIPKYTNIADVLFACLSKSEMLDAALPAKVFSYYAAGRPVLLAMDGEIQKIVAESGAGAFVNAGDSLGFAKSVQELYLVGEGERRRMGENAKDYYNRHFERNINMKKLIDFMF